MAKLFSTVTVDKIDRQFFSASIRPTEEGTKDIQIERKTPAGIFHYLVAAAVVVGVVYYANYKMDW